MGIWLELGIFIVVLGWCFWQLYDVKQAKAQTALKKLADAQKAQGLQAAQTSGEGPAVPPN